MRCPDCGKFVSYDEPECEVGSDPEICGDEVTSTVTVNLNCGECGSLLKSATIDASADFSHDCKPPEDRNAEWEPDPKYGDGEEQYEIEDEGSPEGTSRLQTKDRHDKPIKSHRYMKTFYGFEQIVTVKCRKCGETFEVTLADEEQASAFEEQV